jgi:hypothetical protein
MHRETQELEREDERAGERAMLDQGHRDKNLIGPHHAKLPFDGCAKLRAVLSQSLRMILRHFSGLGRLRLEQTCPEFSLAKDAPTRTRGTGHFCRTPYECDGSFVFQTRRRTNFGSAGLQARESAISYFATICHLRRYARFDSSEAVVQARDRRSDAHHGRNENDDLRSAVWKKTDGM